MVPTGQIERRDIVVHLELVILRAAKDVQNKAIPVGHVLRVGDRNAVWVLQVLVSLVGNLGDRCDDNRIVSAAQLDDGCHGGIVDENRIIAIHGPDGHPLDIRIENAVTLWIHTADCVLQSTRYVQKLIP